MPLTTSITAVIADTDARTLAACFELDRDAIAEHFNVDDERDSNRLFIDIVYHRIQETLFSELTITQHRQWFVNAVLSILRDSNLSIVTCTEDSLTSFAQDVMEELAHHYRNKEANHA